jgi:uncharacterized small protein (DUF1192 family)
VPGLVALDMLSSSPMTELELRQRVDLLQQEFERLTVELEIRRAKMASAVAALEETLRRVRQGAKEYDRAA